MKLIPNWHKSIRYYSQMASLATIGVSLIGLSDFAFGLLPIWRGMIDAETYMLLTAITGTAALIGRTIMQGVDDD